MTEGGDIKKNANRPGGTKFKQQKLPAWQPILTAKSVLPMLFAVGLSFIPLGIAFVVVTNAVKEKTLDYTFCNSTENENMSCSEVIFENITKDCHCSLSFNLTSDFPSPVFIYYGLTSFYQNHRRYIKSRDDNQLVGGPVVTPIEDCKPFDKDPITNKVYAPCGAIANSWFNDSFQLMYESHNATVHISQTDIAWKTDLQTKFKNPSDSIFNNSAKPSYWRNPVQDIPDGYRNESFIVWMRAAAFPSFRKLYGRIQHDNDGLFANGLKKGQYKLTIDYNYPVSKFNGAKKVIITTTSFLGGKNSFLGIAYLVVGSLSLIIGLVFLIIHLRVGTKTHRTMKMPLSKSTPYFDTTMSDLLQSKMNSLY